LSAPSIVRYGVIGCMAGLRCAFPKGSYLSLAI
jgi:hypothetical protein